MQRVLQQQQQPSAAALAAEKEEEEVEESDTFCIEVWVLRRWQVDNSQVMALVQETLGKPMLRGASGLHKVAIDVATRRRIRVSLAVYGYCDRRRAGLAVIVSGGDNQLIVVVTVRIAGRVIVRLVLEGDGTCRTDREELGIVARQCVSDGVFLRISGGDCQYGTGIVFVEAGAVG